MKTYINEFNFLQYKSQKQNSSIKNKFKQINMGSYFNGLMTLCQISIPLDIFSQKPSHSYDMMKILFLTLLYNYQPYFSEVDKTYCNEFPQLVFVFFRGVA